MRPRTAAPATCCVCSGYGRLEARQRRVLAQIAVRHGGILSESYERGGSGFWLWQIEVMRDSRSASRSKAIMDAIATAKAERRL